MKKIQIILMAVLLAAGAGYSALLSVNFESDTVGSQPIASAVRPLINSNDLVLGSAVVVVTNSAIGSGKAARYVDNSGAGTGFEYNFVSGSNTQENAVGVKFTYSQRSTVAVGNSLNIAVGEYSSGTDATLNSAKARFGGINIRDNGAVQSVFNNNAVNLAVPGGAFATGTVHTVELFYNDQNAASINYLQNGTNYSLAANSYAIYIDNTSYGSGSMYLNAPVDGADTNIVGYASVANTEWNLGRFGISTSTGTTGFDVDFDNIVVTALIPEPATMGMLLLGAVTVLAIRRRK